MNKELTKLQEDVAGWWVHFRLAKDEEGCRRALDGAIKSVQNEQLEKVVQWAIKQGFSTGHADNIESLLDEIELDIFELRNG